MSVDVTQMDPIVFANTWHEAEELAMHRNWVLYYSKGAVHPFQIWRGDNRGMVNDFKSILDLKLWLTKVSARTTMRRVAIRSTDLPQTIEYVFDSDAFSDSEVLRTVLNLNDPGETYTVNFHNIDSRIADDVPWLTK